MNEGIGAGAAAPLVLRNGSSSNRWTQGELFATRWSQNPPNANRELLQVGDGDDVRLLSTHYSEVDCRNMEVCRYQHANQPVKYYLCDHEPGTMLHTTNHFDPDDNIDRSLLDIGGQITSYDFDACRRIYPVGVIDHQWPIEGDTNTRIALEGVNGLLTDERTVQDWGLYLTQLGLGLQPCPAGAYCEIMDYVPEEGMYHCSSNDCTKNCIGYVLVDVPGKPNMKAFRVVCFRPVLETAAANNYLFTKGEDGARFGKALSGWTVPLNQSVSVGGELSQVVKAWAGFARNNEVHIAPNLYKLRKKCDDYEYFLAYMCRVSGDLTNNEADPHLAADMTALTAEQWDPNTIPWNQEYSHLLLKQGIIRKLRGRGNSFLEDPTNVVNAQPFPSNILTGGFARPTNLGWYRTYRLANEIIMCINTYRYIMYKYRCKTGNRMAPTWERQLRRHLSEILKYMPWRGDDQNLNDACNHLLQLRTAMYEIGKDRIRNSGKDEEVHALNDDHYRVNLEELIQRLNLNVRPYELLGKADQVMKGAVVPFSHALILPAFLTDCLKSRSRKENCDYMQLYKEIQDCLKVVDVCFETALNINERRTFGLDEAANEDLVKGKRSRAQKQIERWRAAVDSSMTHTLLDIGKRIQTECMNAIRTPGREDALPILRDEYQIDKYLDLIGEFLSRYDQPVGIMQANNNRGVKNNAEVSLGCLGGELKKQLQQWERL